MEKNRESEIDSLPHGNLLQNKHGNINQEGKDRPPKTLISDREIVHYMKKKIDWCTISSIYKGKIWCESKIIKPIEGTRGVKDSQNANHK